MTLQLTKGLIAAQGPAFHKGSLMWLLAGIPWFLGTASLQHGSWLTPQQVIQDREIVTNAETVVFHNILSEVICHHFCHILLDTQANPGTVWEGTTLGCEYQESRLLGAILEAYLSGDELMDNIHMSKS